MATNKKEQKAPAKKADGPKNIAKSFKREPEQKQKTGAEEFEEDQSMNLRMKPQPLNKEAKSSGTKKRS